MSSAPRLYVETDLSQGSEFALDDGQSKYIARVMRLGVGDGVRVFNGRDGEWRCAIAETSGKTVRVRPEEMTRKQDDGDDAGPILLFAPLKKTQTDFVVEKATELGVSALHPVITERTQTRNVRTDRLSKIALEAAEQTERMDVPRVAEPVELMRAIENLDSEPPVIFCDEAGNDANKPWGGQSGRAAPMRDAVAPLAGGPIAILIGPEGGFSPAEQGSLRGRQNVLPVSLGPRILRAETAAISALTIWQALKGDWR